MWASNKGKILIVDDEKFNCDIIYGFLMIMGVKKRSEIAEFALNGEEALTRVQQAIYNNNPFKYSIILMDCNMPFMDGYTATKKIIQVFNQMEISKERHPKIIGVTGHVEKEYVTRALESGMTKVFKKPLQLEEFGSILIENNYI